MSGFDYFTSIQIQYTLMEFDIAVTTTKIPTYQIKFAFYSKASALITC